MPRGALQKPFQRQRHKIAAEQTFGADTEVLDQRPPSAHEPSESTAVPLCVGCAGTSFPPRRTFFFWPFWPGAAQLCWPGATVWVWLQH